jgi:nuclease S1
VINFSFQAGGKSFILPKQHYGGNRSMRMSERPASRNTRRVAMAGLDRLWVTAIALLAIILTPGSGWTWGRIGHEVSSKLAEERLTPTALAAVRILLGAEVSLADASTWADLQREVPDSGPWHYVNVPLSESRYDAKFCQPGGCLVSKIEDFRRVLLDPRAGKTEKQQALKFLVHFIEDLHQPLHIGDTGSRGGNLIQVRFFDAGSNLHQVWDSLVIEHHSENEGVWLWELNGLANPKMVAEWSKGNPEDWATESLADAKLAYRTPGGDAALRSGAKLGNNYCNFALPIIRRQLAKAGVRVAATLNAIFK